MSAALALARDGFAHLPGLLDPALVAELRSVFEAAAASGPSSDFGTILHNPWCRIPAVAAEIQRGTLAELAMRLLGESEVVLFQDLAFCKSPGTRSPVQWPPLHPSRRWRRPNRRYSILLGVRRCSNRHRS